MSKVHSRSTKDPVLGAPLKAGEMLVDGIRYYFDRSKRKVMAQSADSDPYVPNPKDIPPGFNERLMAGQ